MSRWKELPDALDEQGRQLVIQLRRLKDHSGLSLASLETKTGYSRSSWERYLNGKALPPRPAVEELARVVGVEPTRLLALHEVAEETWRSEPAARDDPPPAPRSPRPAVLVGLLTAAVLGALLVGLMVLAPWEDEGNDDRAAPGPASSVTASPGGAFVYKPGKTYPCTVKRYDGQLYAGYSTTVTAVLSQPGWDVVEAQCLLTEKGFDPGGADGVYGENTTRAVKRLQEKAGLGKDGIVGPRTWRVLRG